jgi:hypothetical protein
MKPGRSTQPSRLASHALRSQRRGGRDSAQTASRRRSRRAPGSHPVRSRFRYCREAVFFLGSGHCPARKSQFRKADSHRVLDGFKINNLTYNTIQRPLAMASSTTTGMSSRRGVSRTPDQREPFLILYDAMTLLCRRRDCQVNGVTGWNVATFVRRIGVRQR